METVRVLSTVFKPLLGGEIKIPGVVAGYFGFSCEIRVEIR